MASTTNAPLTAAAALFLVAIALSVFVGVKLDQANNWVMHSYQVILNVDGVVAAVERMEGDARGYVFSGDPRLLAGYHTDVRAMQNKLSWLEWLVRNNDGQAGRVARLSEEAKKREQECDRAIAAFKTDKPEAKRLVLTIGSTTFISGVHVFGDKLLVAERQLLATRWREFHNVELMAAPSIALLAVSGVIMLVISMYTSHRVLAREQSRARELEKANAQLADSRQQLMQARDKALESSALKSAFVANISHEIRTPLSGIIGMNELLLSTDLNADQHQLARIVQESSESLLTVLNDILDLSKIEAGKMTIQKQPVDLRKLVTESVNLMEAAAHAKGLQLHSNIDSRLPPCVLADAERIRQVLLNLIGNAVKFTERGSITVQATVLEDGNSGAKVQFTVSDTGIGIADEDKKFLFVPFAQVDNSNTRRFGGTGLGLAICQRLVHLMGGEIYVHSRPNVGSSFSFLLPFDKETAAPKRRQFASVPRVRRGDHRLVLVVEDNPVLQHLAVLQLSNLGLSSQVARTGKEAVKAVADGTSFDMILMDVHLPKMTGFEATHEIRQIEAERGKHTPIVAMTAGAMEGDRARCLQAGMDDYLSKPVSVDALRSMVDKWLGNNKSDRNRSA